jgi:flagellar biosynthesis protein FliQ
MTAAELGSVMRDMFLVIGTLVGPMLLVGLVIGILVSILQAITQIHETTLAFIPKAIAIGITLALLGPFMMGTLVAYAQRLFDHMISVGSS